MQTTALVFILAPKSLSMKLNLALNGRVLASVPVEAAAIENEYYLKAFRRLLTIRHHQTIITSKEKPSFFIEQQVEVKKALN